MTLCSQIVYLIRLCGSAVQSGLCMELWNRACIKQDRYSQMNKYGHFGDHAIGCNGNMLIHSHLRMAQTEPKSVKSA